MDELRKMMGNLSDEEIKKTIAKTNIKEIEKKNRKNSSSAICKIPDWTGQGGMIEFWINDNGSFECEDDRISDPDIRKALIDLANS